MAETTEKDVLQLDLGVSVDRAVKDVNRFKAVGAKASQAITRGMQALGKSITKLTAGNLNRMSQAIRKATSEYTEYGKNVQKYNSLIARSQKKMLEANEDDKKVLQEKLDRYKKLRDQATKQYRASRTGKFISGAGKGLKEMGGAAKSSGKNFWKAGTSLFRKDFEGGVENAARALGDALSSARVTGKWAKKAGDFFWGKSREKWTGAKSKMSQGNLLGGAGKAVQAAGSAGLGGLMKGLGGLLKMLGQIGPILSLAGASIAAIVKLMIDAEAAAKEMNKKILETAGSSQQFYKNAENGDVALVDMKDTLRGIRDDATALDNIGWGISKEDHVAVINALTQEGVSLDTIKQQFVATGDSAADAAGQAKVFGDAVHVAVAYSREFGVSLQEISSFQGEMMTELGSSLTDVKKTFHEMTKGAAESGIASNKFFAIIRGVSADLNLYNTRMEDAVHMLTQLGKVMSPRNAQKFLGSSMQAVKNMGRVERIKVALLAGPGKTGGVVDRDIKRGTDNLAEKMSSFGKENADYYRKAIEDGGESFTKVLDNLPESMRGELREAQLELSLKRKMRGGGLVGTSLAAGESGPAAQLQIMTDALKKFNGGKSLADGVSSLGEQFMADNLGVSIDQLNQMAKFEIAMNDQKKLLKNGLKDDKVRGKLEKAGIKLTGDDAKDQKSVDEAGFDQIMDTMDEGDKASLEGANKEIDYAKRTSDFTSTISDKIQALIDWLMNKLWDVMNDIYDAISTIASSKWFGGETGTGKIFQGNAAKAQERAMYDNPSTHGKLLGSMADALKSSGIITKSQTSSAIANAASMTDIGSDKSNKLQSAVLGGADLSDAVGQAGLDSGDTAKLLDKLRLQLDSSSLRNFVGTDTGGGGPAAMSPTATAPVTPAHAAAIASKAEQPVTQEQGEAIAGSLDGLQGALEDRGIKINKSFLRNQFWRNGHDAVLDANREALFEYFLYSKMDAGSVAQGLKSGAFNATNFGQQVSTQAATTGQVDMPKLPGMANGGTVPEPKSPDSVFVAARPGEKILPKGTGGTASLTIPINVNGPGGQELANMMRTAALNVVYEWQRKQKYT